MAKEMSIVQATDGSGYIAKFADSEKGVSLGVSVNFGKIIKQARDFFGETIVKGSKNDDQEQAAE